MAVVVLGAGGHGQDIAHTLGAEFVGFYDDAVSGPRVLGRIDDWDGVTSAIIGVNSAETRFDIAITQVGGHFRAFGTWVHPHAHVGPSVFYGDHTHINAGVTVTRTRMGAFCTISPGVTICGDVTIGDFVSIGAGATICNLVTIGDGVTIGAGSVVLPHSEIRDGETWMGVPARQAIPALAYINGRPIDDELTEKLIEQRWGTP